MFEVIVYQDGVEVSRHPLQPGSVNLGRSDDNHIVLKADSVSRRHARFLVDPGRLVIEDLGSGNGTFIGDQRLMRRQELTDGSEVNITPFTLQILAPHMRANPLMNDDPSTDASTVMINIPQGPPPGMAMDSAPAQSYAPGAPTGAQLLVLRGMAARNSYELVAGPFTIGRTDDRDMVLTDPASSRRHANITFEGDHYRVIDNDSANGLIVNGASAKEAELRGGDRILIGETEIEFRWPGGPARSQPMGGPVGGDMGDFMDPENDPYAETNFMPAYNPWEGEGSETGLMDGYEQTEGGYGVEMGAPTEKKSILKPALLAIMLIMVLGIGVKIVSDQSATTEGGTSQASVSDPCASYDLDQGCSDATDEVCRKCLLLKGRMDNGKELFRQKEFSRALQEFQQVLQTIDPQHVEAKRMAYLTYEFWVLTNIEDTVADRSQSLAQKMETLEAEVAKVTDIYEKYGKRRYTRKTSESNLRSAKANLNAGVAAANKALKITVDDPEGNKLQKTAEDLKPKLLYKLSEINGVLQKGTVEKFENDLQALFNDAMAAKRAGRNNEAIKKFTEVINRDTKGESKLSNQAKQEIRAIKASIRNTATPHFQKGVSNMRNGLLLEARQNFTKAISVDPTYTEAKAKLREVNESCKKRGKKLYNEAKIQYNVAQYGQAEKLLNQVLQFVPNGSDEYHQKAQKLLDKVRKQR